MEATLAPPAPNALPQSIPFDDEANEIVKLARSGVPTAFRRLGLEVDPSEGRVETRPPRGALLASLVGRVRRLFGSKHLIPAEERDRLNVLLNTLIAKTEMFLRFTTLAESATEYRDELRRSLATLGQVLDKDTGRSQISPATYKALSQIVDLVELTRRDVQRKALDDPRMAAAFILAHFPHEDQESAIAAMTGSDLDSIHNWRHGRADLGDQAIQRLQLVAQLVYDLRYAMSPEGVLHWFQRPFHEFGNRSPNQLLDLEGVAQAEALLRPFARNLRAQVAT
jgi:hypothetical protein